MPTQIWNDLATWSETEPESDEGETLIPQKHVVRIPLYAYLDVVFHMNQAKEPTNNKVYPPSHIVLLSYMCSQRKAEDYKLLESASKRGKVDRK